MNTGNERCGKHARNALVSLPRPCCFGVLCAVLQGDRGEQWMQQFFPKKSFADSYDGLTTIRRGEGPTEQVHG